MIFHRQPRPAPAAPPAPAPRKPPAATTPIPGPAAPAVPSIRPAGLPIRLLMGVFIVVIYSRLIEILPVRPLAPVGFALLLYGLVTSRWMDWIRTTPTLLLLGLTALMVPSALAGDWPGGSVALLANVWSRSLLYFVIVVTIGRGLAGVGSVMASLAWSIGAVVVMGLTEAGAVGGRLSVGEVSLSNPNELAATLVLALPFCGWYVLGSGRTLFLRVPMAGLTAWALFMLLRTGSRMGLLALLGVAAVVLYISRGRLRVLLLGVTLALGLAAVFFLPKTIQQRFETIVESDPENPDDSAETARAVGSTEARWALIKNSLKITAEHPLLGVGPGNVTTENAGLTKREGARASWQVTHNSYTQISSECGIPAVCFFVGLLVYCLRSTNRLRKTMAAHPELRAHAPIAFWLFVGLVGYVCVAAFGSFAYGFQLPLLAGMVVALEAATADALARPAAPPASTR